MEDIKHGNYLFVLVSTFLVGFMIYSLEWNSPNPKRAVASVSYTQDEGQVCAQRLKKITIESDWKKNTKTQAELEEAFRVCLSSYIQIKTISPKGDEHLAVEFFENIFSELNIAHKSFNVPDLTKLNKSRMNLIATIPADKSNDYQWHKKQDLKSVILINHMDVIDVHPEQWESPDLAFSGKVAGSIKHPDVEYIWGRGALDMKSMAITQLMSMYILKQSNIKLERDIHFLAVADEEQSGSGAIGTLKKMLPGGDMFSLNDASIILNEGGGAMQSLPNEKWNLFLIAVEEKGGAWLDFENNSYKSLVSNLYKSQIINLDEFLTDKTKIKNHGCNVIEVVTPKPKVNVVTSKLYAKFECRQGFQGQELFKNIFEKDFKTVKVEVTQVENIIDISIVTKSSSHGSLGLNESALSSLVLGTHYLGIIDLKKHRNTYSYFKYYQTKATKLFIKSFAKSNILLRIAGKFSFIPFIKKLVLQTVEEEFGVSGLFRTTCQFSALNYKNNHGNALVDCRLLHTAIKFKNSKNHANDFKKELIKKIKDENLKIDIIDGWNVSQSTVRSKDYKVIAKTLKSYAKAERKKIMILPYLFPAGTDSTWFRNPFSAKVEGVKSIPSYGFFPAYLDPDLLGTFHGANERFPVKQIKPTIDKYFEVLKELSLIKKKK
jgi:acetylornithine deacetylase/succinyl-diaminopimelate desuccinylase-like protein